MTAPTTASTSGIDGLDLDLTPSADDELHAPRGLLHDVWVIARRGLLHMRRQPEQLSDATIQPIMFVHDVRLHLRWGHRCAGRAEAGPPSAQTYREFLMGGIMAQTIVFTAFGVALEHRQRPQEPGGSIGSGRCPIAKGAVLGGHAVANLIKALLPDHPHVDHGLRHRLAHPRCNVRRDDRRLRPAWWRSPSP